MNAGKISRAAAGNQVSILYDFLINKFRSRIYDILDQGFPTA